MSFIRSNLKNILIVGVLLIAAFYGYSYFFGGSSNTGSLQVSVPAAVDNSVGKDLLLVLADLRTLKLDDSIFSNPEFRSLKNFRVDLSPEPVGRTNPFAPLSGSSGSAPGNANLQIKSFKTQ